MPDESLSTFAVVVATIVGPILAVQAQKVVERITARTSRRDFIFRTLMATRAARVSTEHVQALNMIDIEFYGNREKTRHVITAWTEYRDHLNTPHSPETLQLWSAKNDDLFFEMLYRMSVSVGYQFERSHIRKSAYSPIAHGDLDKDQTAIRTGLVNLFSGKWALPFVSLPNATPEQAAQAAKEAEEQAVLRAQMTKIYSGEVAYKVEIVNARTLD